MSELQERKNRENNIVIYGVSEIESRSREERTQHDLTQTVEILSNCKTTVEKEEIKKIIRLGKYDKDKKNRPILLTLQDSEKKGDIFKGAINLKDTEKWQNVRLANDLTRAERENERELLEIAKEKEKNCRQGCKYKVRGPPWARRVVKKQPETKE